MTTLFDTALLGMLLVVAVAIVQLRSLFGSVILLSVYSLLMALAYLVLGAPDVAITEAAIGAGISTLLFLAALSLTGDDEKPVRHHLVPLLTVGAVGVLLVYATLGLPALGDPNAVTNTHVASYYVENSMPETGVPNMVTSVLASYRGYDTLGELFVIFTAGISVLALLGGKKKTPRV